ncbi:MAG: PASTA domain-containing protein [Prevotella sp.]|jgi:beta-lactam-binding protein with PASTA domain|nr:PASTA domain-containing protein [Prevotella sp.]
MKSKKFFSKFLSRYLCGNLAAMAMVVFLLCVGVKYGIDIYTHHGEAIPVPNLLHKNFNDAQYILNELGLNIEVSDTGYVRSLPPGCILMQNPPAGEHVKSGHIIYVTINASDSPMIPIPDVIDNCSLREAMAKLTAMGFRLGQPKYIPGEQDWVYGLLVNGRQVHAGDKVSVDSPLIIEVGNGKLPASDSVNFVDPSEDEQEQTDEGGEDPFQEVQGTDPNAPSSEDNSSSNQASPDN